MKVAQKRNSGLIIIPAHNEEGSIDWVVTNCRRAVSNFDILVIDDGSTDATRDKAILAGASVISLPANLGIGGAVQTGYRFAKRHGYSMAVQVDGDGQHDPFEINKLVTRMESTNSDLVIGSRFILNEGFQSTFMRRFGIRVLSMMVKFSTGTTLTDVTSGFRLGSKRVIELFASEYPSDYPEVETIVYLVRQGLRVSEHPVQMNERKAGGSSIHSWKSVYYMIKVIYAILIEKTRRYKKGASLET